MRAVCVRRINPAKMVEEFTDRENEVADLLSRGLSEKMIAAKLFIDPETVRSHTKNMRKKIDGHCDRDWETLLPFLRD